MSETQISEEAYVEFLNDAPVGRELSVRVLYPNEIRVHPTVRAIDFKRVEDGFESVRWVTITSGISKQISFTIEVLAMYAGRGWVQIDVTKVWEQKEP